MIPEFMKEKRAKEVNKKASEYASGLSWGLLPSSKTKNKNIKSAKRIF